MKSLLSNESARGIVENLREAGTDLALHYPGESGRRQPVHTVYGGAHIFRSDFSRKLGNAALRTLSEYAPDAASFEKALGLSEAGTLDGPEREPTEGAANHQAEAGRLAHTIYERVVEKLRTEPVEDFRIDFEDGYGSRPDAEEDGHAASAAIEVAAAHSAGTLSPFIGIRIKPLSPELCERSIRTLEIFVSTLSDKTRHALPGNFVVTLPKVTDAAQVAALADLLGLLETKLDLSPGSLKLELMIETTQSIISRRGEINLPHLVAAARGRCTAAHFGTYDYTASCNITAAYQTMTHPACDFARHMMQVSLGGTGIWLSDGATNILPIAPNRAVEGDGPLTPERMLENRETVHRAWRLHYEHIRHSLRNGFYQGWDLHPAQLPTRYAAVYAFFLESLAPAAKRLRNFVDSAAKATLVGEVFDDAATGQGLLNYFLRAINCGAVSQDEALSLSGLSLAELRTRSFAAILKSRGA